MFVIIGMVQYSSLRVQRSNPEENIYLFGSDTKANIRSTGGG